MALNPTHSTDSLERQALGELAQLVERLLCKQEVTGSSPVLSTIKGRLRPPFCVAAILWIGV